jgi:hypothetical protein
MCRALAAQNAVHVQRSSLRALSRSRTIDARPATPIHVPTRRIAADAPLTIRHANANDFPALERLAALDSHRIPSGELFVGEVDGRLLAAVSIDTGSVIADRSSTPPPSSTLRRARAPDSPAARTVDEPAEELPRGSLSVRRSDRELPPAHGRSRPA